MTPSRVAQEWLPPPPTTFAGVVPRGAALLVDAAVLGAYWALVLSLPFPETWSGPARLMLNLAGPLLYFPVAWHHFGATCGMRLLGLRIVRDRDGTKIDYGVAVVRFVVFLPSVLLTLVFVGLVLAVPVALDHRRRAVHDRLAGTVVLRERYEGSRYLLW